MMRVGYKCGMMPVDSRQPSSTRALVSAFRIYLADRAHRHNLVFVLIGGYGLWFWLWQRSHQNILASYIYNNEIPVTEQPYLPLLPGVVAVVIGGWLLLALLLAWLSQSDLAFILNLGSALILPLSLLAFAPVLAIEGIETEYRWLTLCLIAAMGLVTGAAVQELVQIVGAGRQRRWAEQLERQRLWFGLLIVLILAVAYVVFWCWLTVNRHQSFSTHAFDLGIQDQSFFTLLQRGYPVTTLYDAGLINQFGDHFTPFYYLLAPIYALFPDARTLLVVQSLFLGSGAIPVYLLTWEKTRSAALGLALAVGYLFFPALHGVNAFDFHEIALVTPLLLLGLYWLETAHWRLAAVFLVLAMLTKEEVALSIAAIGLYASLVKGRRRWGGAVAAGSLVYFLLVNLFMMPALGGGPDLARFGELAGYETAGGGFAAILRGLLANPVFAFSYAFLNVDKLYFLALLLLPLALTPLLARSEWLLAVPALAVGLLAQVSVQYSIDYHYPAIMVPFVFFLAASGLQRLSGRAISPVAMAASIVVLSLAMNSQYGWILGKRYPGVSALTEHDRTLHSIMAQIPDDAAVSAMSDLVPHLSARNVVRLFPIVADADFVLFDRSLDANFWPYTGVRARSDAIDSLLPYLSGGAYGLVRQEDGVLLFQKGQGVTTVPEVAAALLGLHYEAESQPTDLNAPSLPDPAASNGLARRATAESLPADGKTALVFGPYVRIHPGRYRVEFTLKIGGDTLPGRLATLDVFTHEDGYPRATRDITAADLTAPDQYQRLALDFETDHMLEDVEFRVHYGGQGELWLDRVDLTPLAIWLTPEISNTP